MDVVRSMNEIEQPSYYAVIPANVRYDSRLKPNEKLLYGEITSLSNKTGLCFASNRYFAELYEVEIETVSRWIKHLKELEYIETDILYFENTNQVNKRIIKIDGVPIVKKINTYCLNNQEGIDKKIKYNNTSINNNNLNEFKLYNNWNQNLKCECVSKSTNQVCERRSTYSINGKNYCNQHSKSIIKEFLDITRFQKPTLEEVTEYCIERNNDVNPQSFIDYYESNGWKVGQNPMKDWKAAVRTWENNEKKRNKNKFTSFNDV